MSIHLHPFTFICPAILVWETCSYNPFIQSTVHRIGLELDDGKIYRKPLYLMVKTMVSCRFSLEPIELWIRWALQLSGVAGSLGHRSRRAALGVALGSPADAAHGAAPSAKQRYGLCGVPGLRAYWEPTGRREKQGGNDLNMGESNT